MLVCGALGIGTEEVASVLLSVVEATDEVTTLELVSTVLCDDTELRVGGVELDELDEANSEE